MKLPKNWVNFFRLNFRKSQEKTASIKATSKQIYAKVERVVVKRPLISFFSLLLVLFVLIALGSFITKPKPQEEETAKEPISVETYSLGSAPRITVPATVEKEGVITIAAQTSAIVGKINVKDGQSIKKGQSLVSLASNYQGSNAATIQRQLASIQAQTAQITFDSQKDIIARQRELAEKTDSGADELRDIAQDAKDETNSLVSLNVAILSQIESNIQTLEATNVGGANNALILQTKQLQSQFLSATNQARSALRSTELAANENKPTAQISNLSREVAIKQLDLQEKTLKLGVEAANLQARLAKINESLFFPTSPFTGIVERVHVKTAQQVSPGMPLVTISSSTKSQTAVAYLPVHIAKGISKLNSSFLIVGDQKYEVQPIYVSQEAVTGQLHSAIFPIPAEAADTLTDLGFVDVEIPVGYSYASQTVPYIPLDAVHQTQDRATVFVIYDQRAEGKTVTLGQVQGNFIEITSGLAADDQIIVSRNIVSGDPVSPKTP